MSDSALPGSVHLYWLCALAALVPLLGALRASRRSGADWSRPVVALQVAASLAIAGLALLPLLGARIGAWVPALWLPAAVVAPACVLLLALGASSRTRQRNRVAILAAFAAPALLLLALAASSAWGVPGAEWTHRWLVARSDSGLFAGWCAALPLSFAAPCLVASLFAFLSEYAQPPKRNARQAALAGAACAVPALAALGGALLPPVPALDVVALSYLVPSAIFGWVLYPGRSTHLDVRMAAIDALGEAVLIIDRSNQIVDANSRAIELLKPASGDLRGFDAATALRAIPELLAMLADPSKLCGEFFLGKSAGSRRCLEARVHTLEGEESEGSRVFAIRDITSSRDAENKLFYQAHFDSLTGLPNRRFFLDKISTMINEAKLEGHQVALMYLDFDHFKEINDSLGHSAGDELLRIMAHRLRQHLRSGDTLSRTASPMPPEVSRLGGDEFAILMSRFSTVEAVEEVARRILSLVADPVTLAGQCVWNACSIGIALFPDHGTEIASLVKSADSALYYAKSQSRGQYEFYRPEFGSKIVRKASLEKQLRGAIDAKELVLHYQPKIDIAREEVAGAEALLRWENPVLGTVPPKEFIPVAEDSGLIASIGAWVITSACSQIQQWREAGLTPIPISVNVSCFQFTRMDLRQIVASALAQYDVPPSLLELELTESALLADNDQTASCLRELRAIGVRISLDDFGTGYSALSYLSRVPLDVLKMDRAFIRDVHSDPSAAGVASAVVAMAHSLNLRVVAEGVDCAEQIAPLRTMGCDLIQGFIFSAAVSAEEFAVYLTPKGRKLRIASYELPPGDSVAARDVDAPTAHPKRKAGSPRKTGHSDERHALIVDDDRMQIGRTAMRMNQMGIPSYYARDPDEGVLFAHQEPGRIRALFVSSETPRAVIERIASEIADLSDGERPSIVMVGEKFDATAIAELRQKTSIWSLRIPFDDAELSFVADAALSTDADSRFPQRNRAPVHLMVWTRVGDASGHGVITSLSPRGAFVEMDEAPPVGTALHLEFSLGEWPVAIRARVVYLHGNDDGRSTRPAGVGVVFLDRDRDTEDRIVEEIEKGAVRFVS